MWGLAEIIESFALSHPRLVDCVADKHSDEISKNWLVREYLFLLSEFFNRTKLCLWRCDEAGTHSTKQKNKTPYEMLRLAHDVLAVHIVLRRSAMTRANIVRSKRIQWKNDTRREEETRWLVNLRFEMLLSKLANFSQVSYMLFTNTRVIGTRNWWCRYQHCRQHVSQSQDRMIVSWWVVIVAIKAHSSRQKAG